MSAANFNVFTVNLFLWKRKFKELENIILT